jgi:membrane glycosyltransferase
LLAPVAMSVQSIAVVSILAGHDGGWRPQRRDDGHIALREIARRYALHTLFGLALGVAAYLVAPSLFLWMSPVVLGLSLAIPLAAVTAEPRLGRGLRRCGLLLTPEEAAPPAVVVRALRLQRDYRAALPAQSEALHRLVSDPVLLDLHRDMLPPPRRPRLDPPDPVLLVGLAKLDEAPSLDAAAAELSTAEKTAILADRRGIERLSALSRDGAEDAVQTERPAAFSRSR